MNDFRRGIADLIAADRDDDSLVREDVVGLIMARVREAIEQPLVSNEIDAWMVLTMMGKQGNRPPPEKAGMISAVQLGEQRIERFPDERIQIFCRIYEIERTAANVSPEHARILAMAAADRFSPVAAYVG